MRPPHISPQEWFDNLPECPDAVTTSSILIFKGQVNNLENIVCRLDDNSNLHLLRSDFSDFWCFDYASGSFVGVRGQGTSWASQIIVASGKPWQTGGSEQIEVMNQSMVRYGLSPI